MNTDDIVPDINTAQRLVRYQCLQNTKLKYVLCIKWLMSDEKQSWWESFSTTLNVLQFLWEDNKAELITPTMITLLKLQLVCTCPDPSILLSMCDYQPRRYKLLKFFLLSMRKLRLPAILPWLYSFNYQTERRVNTRPSTYRYTLHWTWKDRKMLSLAGTITE